MSGENSYEVNGATNNALHQNVQSNGTMISNSPASDSEPYDLICVGFGPASLAIAVALHDTLATSSSPQTPPRVLYLERQPTFKWHGGMLLPSARMQISFLKDLATLRNPQSKFTFLNYLHSVGRLVQFVNLSTFLPLREEYNEYMTWCAKHFEADVRYGRETTAIDPIYAPNGEKGQSKVHQWRVTSRDISTNETTTVSARHVVIAVGGRPKIPPSLTDESEDSPIVHSSSYRTIVPKMLDSQKGRRRRRVAVVGGGQSAAEIFNDLTVSFADAEVRMYTGDSALRPSDDSPFVNEIFDPSYVSHFYSLPPPTQQSTLLANKSTNYGVVRPDLLDKLYENMYHQRIHEPDDRKWRYRIVTGREVVGFKKLHGRNNEGRLRLRLRDTVTGEEYLEGDDARTTSNAGEHLTNGDEHALTNGVSEEEEDDKDAVDLLIVATGYIRNAHEWLLSSSRDLLAHKESDDESGEERGKFVVGRDYRVLYDRERVEEDCGVWLQGCCQDSHGLSDTLLSILAVRGGEMIDFIFPWLKGKAKQGVEKVERGDLGMVNGEVDKSEKGLAKGLVNGETNGIHA